MDAFFLIDKPSGITSFQVLRELRKKLGIKKIGHSGTLDPLATGGLLVATGNYTKLLPFVEKDRKSYIADIYLDGESDSYDSDTEVRYISSEKQKNFQKMLTLKSIEKILRDHFFGTITQVPPKYSALKIGGKRALDRTLAGEEIVMKAREAEIFSFNIIEFDYPLLKVELEVSAGTYIRSIAHDLGNIIGSGGYLRALRRTKVGSIDITLSVSVENIDSSHTLDLYTLFGERIVTFTDETVYTRLSQGQRVRGDFDFPGNSDILLHDQKNIRYVVEYKGGVIHPRKKIT